MKQWYEQLFENYSRSYDNEVFTKGTMGECDFIEKEISNNKNIPILDIGCGTGRHAIELAKRGFRVTGIDLSESQLARAGQKAAAAGVSVDFQKHDARDLPFNNEFGLVIMICEGAFSLMETDEMNFQILTQAFNALAKNGKFIFTALNGLFPLFHSVKEFIESKNSDTTFTPKEQAFDLMTFREHSVVNVNDDDGNAMTLHTNERYYVPSEITWLLSSLGFSAIDIFGAKPGEFSREHILTTEDYEMLVVAEKKA